MQIGLILRVGFASEVVVQFAVSQDREAVARDIGVGPFDDAGVIEAVARILLKRKPSQRVVHGVFFEFAEDFPSFVIRRIDELICPNGNGDAV